MTLTNTQWLLVIRNSLKCINIYAREIWGSFNSNWKTEKEVFGKTLHYDLGYTSHTGRLLFGFMWRLLSTFNISLKMTTR